MALDHNVVLEDAGTNVHLSAAAAASLGLEKVPVAQHALPVRGDPKGSPGDERPGDPKGAPGGPQRPGDPKGAPGGPQRPPGGDPKGGAR